MAIYQDENEDYHGNSRRNSTAFFIVTTVDSDDKLSCNAEFRPYKRLTLNQVCSVVSTFVSRFSIYKGSSPLRFPLPMVSRSYPRQAGPASTVAATSRQAEISLLFPSRLRS